MSAPDALFWLFSVLMLACGLLVLLSTNAVTSAVFLVLLFFFMAGLFVLLDAYFLAVIQILVYTGAVMVLFLFVVMLLGVKEPRRWWWRNGLGIAGMVSLLIGFLLLLPRLLGHGGWRAPEGGTFTGLLVQILKPLFTRYQLPLILTGLLLLVATIGIVLLGRREEKS